jgi:hypothetical protein
MHGIKHYHSVSDKIHEEEFKDTKGITGKMTKQNVKTRVSLMEQELSTLPEHLSSPRFLVGFVLLDLQFPEGIIRIRHSNKDRQHNN